jgi:hypothetical protein
MPCNTFVVSGCRSVNVKGVKCTHKVEDAHVFIVYGSYTYDEIETFELDFNYLIQCIGPKRLVNYTPIIIYNDSKDAQIEEICSALNLMYTDTLDESIVKQSILNGLSDSNQVECKFKPENIDKITFEYGCFNLLSMFLFMKLGLLKPTRLILDGCSWWEKPTKESDFWFPSFFSCPTSHTVCVLGRTTIKLNYSIFTDKRYLDKIIHKIILEI